jgi:hypothetical protein
MPPRRTNPPASNSIVGHFLHPPTDVRVLPGDVGHSELRQLGDALPPNSTGNPPHAASACLDALVAAAAAAA